MQKCYVKKIKGTVFHRQPVSFLSGENSVLRICTLDRRVDSLEMKVMMEATK
jgi:hypothetical protein